MVHKWLILTFFSLQNYLLEKSQKILSYITCHVTSLFLECTGHQINELFCFTKNVLTI